MKKSGQESCPRGVAGATIDVRGVFFTQNKPFLNDGGGPGLLNAKLSELSNSCFCQTDCFVLVLPIIHRPSFFFSFLSWIFSVCENQVMSEV